VASANESLIWELALAVQVLVPVGSLTAPSTQDPAAVVVTLTVAAVWLVVLLAVPVPAPVCTDFAPVSR
jgi:hypothetical protein